MSLLSWNCRGIGNHCIVHELLFLIKEKDPSVLFLSEMRLDNIGVENLRVTLKFAGAFCVFRMYTGGGLAMLSDRVDLKLNTYSRNH